MRARGVSLRELCREAALDPSFFSKVLSGKRSPPSEEAALRRLARLLSLDETELIVSAGRVPSEWAPLWQHRALFDQVNALASNSASVARRMPSSFEPRRMPKPVEVQPQIVLPKSNISDELL